MPKTKYRYNPKTLTYEEVKLTLRDKIWRGVLLVLPSVVLMIVGGFIAMTTLPTPKEKQQANTIAANQDVYMSESKEVEFLTRVVEHLEEREKNLLRPTFGMEAYPDHLRTLGVGGSDRFAKFRDKNISDILVGTAKSIDTLRRRIYALSKSYDQIEEVAKNHSDMMAAIPSIQPISNQDLTRIASGFGMRIHPVYRIPKMHTGIDMTADPGTEIYAAGAGVVEKVDWFGGYGKIVIINHGFGYKTYYAHCSNYNVKVGQLVKRGEVIAYVGNTGISTGPHLHYEVRKKLKDPASGRYFYKPVDPVHYFFQDLTPEEYNRVIEIAAKATMSMS